MTNLKLAVGSLMIGLSAFVAGAWTSSSRDWGRPVATANIVNTSDEPVEFVVRFDSCGHRGSVKGEELASGASREIRYVICGEAGQAIEAKFRDGTTVSNTGAYVESGNRTTDEISRNGIKPR